MIFDQLSIDIDLKINQPICVYFLYNYLNGFQMRVYHIFAHSFAQLVAKPIGHPSMRQENRSKQPRSQPVYLKNRF